MDTDNCTVSFYIRDLNIPRFWYTWGGCPGINFLEIPRDNYIPHITFEQGTHLTAEEVKQGSRAHGIH